MENIAVVLRVRPILTSERKHGDASCIEVVGESKKKVQVKVNPTRTDYYKCTRCFARDTSQAQLFYESGLTSLIDEAMKGNDVCVYSYGESRSGKTFTMFGTPKRVGAKEKQSGLILRSLRYIFTKLSENNIKVQLRVSSVEIKDEQVFDLFLPVEERTPLVLQEDELENTNILDLTKLRCSSYASASEILEEIIQNRCSRQETDSHCLTEIHISIPLQTEDNNVTYVPLGKISFADLMNSATLHGNQHSEEHAVDNSLHVITHVIDGIEHEDNNDISVMDSVLSKLLSRCVGVRGRSLLVACVCEAKLNVEETLRTLKFSCKPAPKQPKYLDPQAKLVYDLKKELHVLSHRNRQLRATIIKAPTWELHAMSHSSPKAMKQEIADEKALIAMHNEILKANETYTFKPRTGGRMYFPSPVAGREIPIKPTKKFLNERELLKSGGFLENSSIWTGGDTESQAVAGGAEGSLVTGETRPTTSNSQVKREISVHTVEDLMRRQGTTGPLVFKIKRESGMETVDPATRVKQVLPLRTTTRLGFGRAGRDWEQSDWPAEIRKRVTDKEARDALLAEAGKPKDPGPMFKWKQEEPEASPFVAHLTTKPPPEPERPAFLVHNWPCCTFSDPESDPRPVTAPSKRRPYHPFQDTRALSHTSSSENATTATEGLDGTTPDESRPSTGRVHRKHSKSHSHSHTHSETTHTGGSGGESLEHTASTTTSAHSAHSEHHLTSEEAADAALIASLHNAASTDESAPGFNPLKPSVFAASLMSDQSNLTRRHSTVESLAAFASSMTHIDITANKLASVVEEETGGSGMAKRGTKPAPKLKHMYRQNSGRSRHSVDSDSTNSGGKTPSNANSFSSLPAVDGVAPALQKSQSIRSTASGGGSGRF